MLRNLVRLRYADAPVFLDVGQIVSGYSWERGVSVSGQLAKTGGSRLDLPRFTSDWFG